MRKQVEDAFLPFTVPLEGAVPFLYCDVLGLVTTAIGVLVDPIDMALTLPLRHPVAHRTATRTEIADDWHRVKERQDLRERGGMAYGQVARLRLDNDGIREVTLRKLDGMVWRLRGRFGEWDQWPADAQLAILSLSWACGPAFRFPRLAAHLRAQDWTAAATECDIRPDHGTIRKRNAWQRLCLSNAAKVARNAGDPERLWWPEVAPEEPVTDPATPEAIEHRGGGAMAIEGIVDGLGKGKGWRPGED